MTAQFSDRLLGRHLSLQTTQPDQVTNGIRVHKQTLLDLDDQHGGAVRQGQTLSCEMEQGPDTVWAELADKSLQRVDLRVSEPAYLASIGHGEH